jgi:apoptosis-inducing factor 3
MAPISWSQHYDVPIHYVGHAETWDAMKTICDIGAHKGLVSSTRIGTLSQLSRAVASIRRDKESFRAELALEGSK